MLWFASFFSANLCDLQYHLERSQKTARAKHKIYFGLTVPGVDSKAPVRTVSFRSSVFEVVGRSPITPHQST